MGDKLAWVKKKELGLPLGVWALIAAVGILYVYRKHKGSAGSSSGSSTNPNAADTSASPSSGGASDQSSALAAIANELAMEEQILSSVLDRLQGKKHKHHRPHGRKHHPKHHRAPHTSKTPITHHRHKDKVRKGRPPHPRSSGGGGGRVPVSEAGRRPTRPTSVTARSLGVTQGGLRKPFMGLLPKNPTQPLAHPRGELDPNVERIVESANVSYTRGVSNTAKRLPNGLEQHHPEVARKHPASTKPRKH